MKCMNIYSFVLYRLDTPDCVWDLMHEVFHVRIGCIVVVVHHEGSNGREHPNITPLIVYTLVGCETSS